MNNDENAPVTLKDLRDQYDKLHKDIDQTAQASARAFAALLRHLDKNSRTGGAAEAVLRGIMATPAPTLWDDYLRFVIADLLVEPHKT